MVAQVAQLAHALLFHMAHEARHGYAAPALSYHPRTLNIYRQSEHQLERLRNEEPDDGKRRLPLTWGDCQDDDGPCPYVSCSYHLFLGVDPSTGSLKLNFPALFDADGAPELDEMPATCALRVAERGPITLETMGEMLNLTRERARQLEVSALETLRKRLMQIGVDSYESPVTVGIFETPYTDGMAD